MAAPKGSDVTLIDCEGPECGWPLSIPATMIGHEAGEHLREKLLDSTAPQLLSVSFQEQQVSALLPSVSIKSAVQCAVSKAVHVHL